MILLVSWRPPFGRLMFYYLFMRLSVPSPSSLRSHNASVMFCQVKHDGRGEAPGGMEEGNFWSQAAFSWFKIVKTDRSPTLSPEGHQTSQCLCFFSFHIFVSLFSWPAFCPHLFQINSPNHRVVFLKKEYLFDPVEAHTALEEHVKWHIGLGKKKLRNCCTFSYILFCADIVVVGVD